MRSGTTPHCSATRSSAPLTMSAPHPWATTARTTAPAVFAFIAYATRCGAPPNPMRSAWTSLAIASRSYTYAGVAGAADLASRAGVTRPVTRLGRLTPPRQRTPFESRDVGMGGTLGLSSVPPCGRARAVEQRAVLYRFETRAFYPSLTDVPAPREARVHPRPCVRHARGAEGPDCRRHGRRAVQLFSRHPRGARRASRAAAPCLGARAQGRRRPAGPLRPQDPHRHVPPA